MTEANHSDTSSQAKPTSNAYAHYVLCILVLVYVFNVVDRNVLSILVEDIEADLGLSDAHMGFCC